MSLIIRAICGFVVLSIASACKGGVSGVSSESGPASITIQSQSSEVPQALEPGKINPELWPELTPAFARDEALETRIENILAGMSVEEKVGQTLMAEVNGLTPEDVKKYDLGSVLAGGTSAPGGDIRAPAHLWLEAADAYYNASVDTSDGGSGIPIFWGIDAVHGHNNIVGATIFPHNIGLGASRDADLVERIANITALEMRATGQEWNFAPSLYVPRDHRWGRVYEGFSESVEISKPLAAAAIEGLQGRKDGDGFLKSPYVIATAKTWLGDGDMADGRDQGDVREDEATMRDLHAAPFISAIESGAQTVMASFSSYHGQAIHGHKPLLTDILRDRFKFDGLVVGDWDGHRKVDGCTNTDCPQALSAGLDIYMAPQSWKALRKNLIEQVEDGRLPEGDLDEAVRRVLRVKLRTGLFDGMRPSERGGDLAKVGAPEHWEVAREAVRKSLVLLKNDGVLPIAASATVLVAGDGADNIPMQNGGWSLTWQGTDTTNADFPGATSIIDAVRDAVASNGGQVVTSIEDDPNKIPDVAIIVFGEAPYAEWRGDQVDVDFKNDSGFRALRALRELNVPTVSVFLSGRPLYVNPELNASNAFVAGWLPGGAGAGIADLLISEDPAEASFDFVGRLPFAWPGHPTQARPSDPDSNGPLFPIGYGLSYAQPQKDIVEFVEYEISDAVAQNEAIFYANGTLLENSILLIESGGVEVHLEDAKGLSDNGALSIDAIDRDAQEDARELVWTERAALIWKQLPQVSPLQHPELQISLSRRSDVEGAISAHLDCVGGGAAVLDLTDRIKNLPLGEWTTERFKLECSGQEASERNALKISSDSPATLLISDVRLVRGSPPGH